MRQASNGRTRSPSTTRTLACPFFRCNPWDNIRCASLTLRRPRDVKHHLMRDHRLPLYCPTCGRSDFANVAERDRHIQDERCVAPPGAVPADAEGLDPGQVTQLHDYRARRRQGVAKTWGEIWAIARPNDPCPPNIFMGGIFEEVVGMIREYLNAQEAIHRCEILASVPADQAGQVWQATRRYMDMGLTGFLVQNVVANSCTGPVLGLNSANASHGQASDDGVDPRLLGNDQESYHYSAAFYDSQYFNFDNLQ